MKRLPEDIRPCIDLESHVPWCSVACPAYSERPVRWDIYGGVLETAAVCAHIDPECYCQECAVCLPALEILLANTTETSNGHQHPAVV